MQWNSQLTKRHWLVCEPRIVPQFNRFRFKNLPSGPNFNGSFEKRAARAGVILSFQNVVRQHMWPPRVIKAQLVAVFNNALQESRQKIHRWKQQCYILCLELNDCAQSFVFVYKFCPNELMRFLKISHWFTGAGGRGGKGDPNLPLPYLKFPPPQTFLTSHPESRFSPCILRNIEYCCVISPFFPLLPPASPPLFPTLFWTPTSRPFLSLLSYPCHPFVSWAPTPWPIWLS